MPPDLQLSDPQLAVMRVVWDCGEVTAQEVHAALVEQDRELAPTTVATMLSRLEKRGFLCHRTEGRQYVYRATVPEGEVRRSMLTRLTDFFFSGDSAALLSHLVDDRDITTNELEAIRRTIALKERIAAEEDDDDDS